MTNEQQTGLAQAGLAQVEAGESGNPAPGAVKPKRRPPPPIPKRSDAEVEAIVSGKAKPKGRANFHLLSPKWQEGQRRKAAAEALKAGGAATIPGSLPVDQDSHANVIVHSDKSNAVASESATGQFLARQGVTLARILEHAPDAVDLIGKIVRGRLKAPIGIRLQAAFKVLDAGGINAAVGERIEAALKQPGGASLQSLAAKLVEASNLAKKRAEVGQKSGKAPDKEGDSPL